MVVEVVVQSYDVVTMDGHDFEPIWRLMKILLSLVLMILLFVLLLLTMMIVDLPLTMKKTTLFHLPSSGYLLCDLKVAEVEVLVVVDAFAIAVLTNSQDDDYPLAVEVVEGEDVSDHDDKYDDDHRHFLKEDLSWKKKMMMITMMLLLSVVMLMK